jgi:hypothetical protein
LDQIFKSTLRWIVDNYGNRISLTGRKTETIPEFDSTYTIIDCTECTAWTYGPRDHILEKDKGYSGKKKLFTIKYQVVVGVRSGAILDVFGPVFGSVHDAKIYAKSGFDDFLWNNNEYCLGDRGYQGCPAFLYLQVQCYEADDHKSVHFRLTKWEASEDEPLLAYTADNLQNTIEFEAKIPKGFEIMKPEGGNGYVVEVDGLKGFMLKRSQPTVAGAPVAAPVDKWQ